MKKIKPLLRSVQNGYHFRGRRLFANYVTHIQRLTDIKQALLECSLEMDVFLSSAAVWKTNVRQVAECGEDAELVRMLEYDDQLRKIMWYPNIIKVIGKFNLVKPNLHRKKVFPRTKPRAPSLRM